MPRFNIGDRVRVKAKTELGPYTINAYLAGDMESYADCEAVVTVINRIDNEYVELDICNDYWWHKSLLELIPDEDTTDLIPADDHEIGVLLGLRG